MGGTAGRQSMDAPPRRAGQRGGLALQVAGAPRDLGGLAQQLAAQVTEEPTALPT